MKPAPNQHELPADVRALVVRQLGAALAARWRREHGHVDGDSGRDERVEERKSA